MGSIFSIRTRSSFELPIIPASAIGTVGTIVFYGLLLYGPLDNAVLKRYCLSNATAGIAVWLFGVVLASIAMKLYRALEQHRIFQTVQQTIDKFVVEGQDVARHQRALWLEAHWLALPQSQRESCLGSRVADLLERQISPGRSAHLESDLREQAEDDARAQQASYSLVRIVCCVIPMLGLLGTLIGISSAAEQLSSQSAARNAQSVSTPIVPALMAACDPISLALVLTIPLVFLQFVVHRAETNLLSATNAAVRDDLLEFLATEPQTDNQDLVAPVRQMAEDLVSAVHQLVEQQATLWTRSLTEAQKQWSSWSTSASDQMRAALCESLQQSLTQHSQEIERVQQEAGRQIDARWQQWQITLSDQARVMHAQQKELVRQTESIERLITCTTDLKKVEEVVRESFGSFEIVEQLKQSTLGVAEAVAALGGSLERAGIIRGAPVKPRVIRKPEADDEQLASRKVA